MGEFDWVFEFPQDQEHRTVEVYEQATVTMGYLNRGELISTHPAMGAVSVPDGKFVNLKLNGVASRRMSLLSQSLSY